MRRSTTQSTLRPPRGLVARVRRFAVERDAFAPGDRVLVAVSGGPDSTCLLLTLAALRRSFHIELHAAYFDHQLRGAWAAERERRFVRSLTEALGVPLQSGAGDVRAHAHRHKRSIEEAARELRYRFLATAARNAGCSVVALGHTRDDQAETVLLHLLRGSGLRGLAGMRASSAWPVRANDPPRLVRPLLALPRADTEACCREAGLTPVADPSNRSRVHLRNRVRAELLPLLRRYNPRIDDALARLADAATADIALLEALASEALAGEATDGTVRLPRRQLTSMPDALQRHVARLAIARLLGDARGLSERHVRAVLRAAGGPTGAALDLPRGVRVDVRRDAIIITTAKRRTRALPARPVPLPIPGTVRFGPWRLEAKVLARRPQKVDRGDPLVAYLDAAACEQGLTVRRRRPGDRFQPLGLAWPKKLQDFLVDAHVSRDERDALPLICSRRGIAWIAGQRPAEWAKVTESTKRVVRLRARRAGA